MPAIPAPFELLRRRLRAFTRTLPSVAGPDTQTVDRAWEASRRLREILPVLELDASAAEKLAERLGKVTKRLATVGQTQRLLELLDDLDATERRNRYAVARMRVELQRLAQAARAELSRRRSSHDARRTAEKLAAVVEQLSLAGQNRTHARTVRWALRARVARRSADLKDAIGAAGSVYLPGRLRAVHAALRKLRYGAELASQLAGFVDPAEARTLARTQALLGRVDDLQVLITHIRDAQSLLPTPDVKAWRDLDAVVIALETRCRGLHARYVRDREALVALCDRLASRAPADGARRKVG